MKTQIFSLKNGAKVLFNKQTDVRGITVELNFTAGAINDKKGKLGIAHFCEHAIFGFPNAKMSREERASYKRKFHYFNAYTNFSMVVFIIQMTEEDFEDAIDFLTEPFLSIKLNQEEFEKEKKIIEDEIKTRVQRNSAQYGIIERTEIIKDEQFKNLITSPAGMVETLNNITLEDIKEFISEYLTLNNLCVSISGNISKNRVKKAMHKYVEARIGTSSKQGLLTRDINELYTPKYHFDNAAEEGKALLSCVYTLKHIPWTYEVHRDWLVSAVLSMVLREYAYLYYRQKKNLCYSCSLEIISIANHLTNEFYIECQEENLQEVIECYNEFLNQLPENIGPEMFEKHKRKMLLSYNFDFLGITKVADAMFSVYFRENKLFNTKYIKEVLKDKKSVTYDEVNAMYKTIFSVKPHITIISNDEKYKDFDYKSFAKVAQLKRS